MKPRLLDDHQLRAAARRYGTPLYLYRAEPIRRQIRALLGNGHSGFDVVRYAQKANSNLSLLELIREQGAQVDAVSSGEVERALAAGFDDSEIHLSADLFDRAALELLQRHRVHVNLGSADMIEQYAALGAGSEITLRVNPGFGHGHDLKVNTGGPQSKHGIWHEQLAQAVQRAERCGLQVVGLHLHIGSGSNFDHLSRVRHALELMAPQAGDAVRTISAGGGLPVPYRPADEPFDVQRYVADWLSSKATLEQRLDRELTLEVEPGRFLVAEAGALLAEVRATKDSGDLHYVLVDAGFDNLLRPAMYGSYHHISVVGRDEQPTEPVVVAGPLCESADMFTQRSGGVVEPRQLPRARVGDLVYVHDTGAYAASMASNYNSRLLAAEVLFDDSRSGDSMRLIRRRQTVSELIAAESGL